MRPQIEQAVALLQQKRPDAMDQALALLQDTVFSFSMKLCGHREDAEDTMQGVLMKSVRYLPTFTSPQALVVWLYKVARNHCLMSRRRSKFAPKEHLSLEELMPDRQELETLAETGEPSPEQSLLKEENADLLRQSVLKIPAPYRLVLVLHDMEELSTEEVARVTGLREGTVRVRLHRARLFLRNELTKRMKAQAARQARVPHPLPSAARQRVGTAAPHGQCQQLFAALSDYLDGALDPRMCEHLEKHMAGCAPCELFLASLKTTVASVKKYRPGDLDRETAQRVRKSVIEAYDRTLGGLKQTKAASR